MALLPGGADCFEDFHDKIGVSFETFRDRLTGGWLFNYVDALRTAGVRTVLFFSSSRSTKRFRFTHAGTGARVDVLPAPRLHRKLRNAQVRFGPDSSALLSVASYVATPLRQLAAELRREGCQAILCQEYEHPRFDACVLLGMRLRLPVFATYQGADHTESWVERPLRAWSMRRCAGLIIGASSEIRRVRDRYRVAPERIAHIPNPFDTRTWTPGDRRAARAELGIPADARVVVWHGRVQVWRKGLDVLLDAWEMVCRARPDARLLLLLVGSGRNTAELDRRARSDPRVRWIDRYVLDRNELWRYLSAADVYALPSRHEGFAVAPIEAMACGLPVIAADASGVADLLAEGEAGGGVIVPREDTGALAAALGRLLDHESTARQLGARARRRAEQEFSLEVVGRRLGEFMFGTEDRLVRPDPEPWPDLEP